MQRFAALALDALERVRASELEHRILERLQARLLEIDLRAPTATVAVRYQPSDKAFLLGGDWYDILSLESGRVGITVGDVVGSGLSSATVMSQLRSALGVAATRGETPAAAVSLVDAYARRLPDALGTTLVYLELAPDGTLRWCGAGHMPPLVARNERAEFLPPAQRPPLGSDLARRSRADGKHGYPAGRAVARLHRRADREARRDHRRRLPAAGRGRRGEPASPGRRAVRRVARRDEPPGRLHRRRRDRRGAHAGCDGAPLRRLLSRRPVRDRHRAPRATGLARRDRARREPGRGCPPRGRRSGRKCRRAREPKRWTARRRGRGVSARRHVARLDLRQRPLATRLDARPGARPWSRLHDHEGPDGRGDGSTRTARHDRAAPARHHVRARRRASARPGSRPAQASTRGG